MKKKKSSFLGHTHNHTQLYTQSGKEELESLIKNKGEVEKNVRKNEKSGNKTNNLYEPRTCVAHQRAHH